MKKYNSTVEGTWIELVDVQLTEEEKALLLSSDENDIDAKKQLVAKIKSEREKTVTSSKASELSALYDSQKPELKSSDVYELIAIDVLENNGFSGIMNYRLNGEHKQIRF